MTTSGPAAQRRSFAGGVGQVFLWLWLVLGLVPLLFMVVTSFKPAGVVNQIPPAWVFRVTFDNYASVLAGGPGVSQGFGQLLMNSAIVSLGSTALTVLLAVPAGYALSMRTFRARKRISGWILSTYMFPPSSP